MAYREGRGIRENAAKHLHSAYLLKMDFQRFFPSLRPTDLEKHIEEFLPLTFGREDLRVISRACFWKPRNRSTLRLSIGACSSPFISNTLMYKFDQIVEKAAKQRDIIYTRYADDLTLSTSRSGQLRRMESEIRRIAGELRYPKLKFNDEKTIHTSKKYHRRVTGLVLSSQGKISLGRSKKREIMSRMHHALHRKAGAEEIERLKGLIAYSFDVEPEFVSRLEKKYGEDKIAQVLGKTAK